MAYIVSAYSSLKSKASEILSHSPLKSKEVTPPLIDGDIVFSKNNICVHSECPETHETMHSPGYLCIMTLPQKHDKDKDDLTQKVGKQQPEFDLVLKWTPNVKLSRQLSTESTSSVSSDLSNSTKMSSFNNQSAVCRGVFLCNLMHMRSIRLAYDSDQDLGLGYIVIESPESQFKLFHFHSGGLTKFEQLLTQWSHIFRHRKKKSALYSHYLVRTKSVTDSEKVHEPKKLCIDAFEDFVSNDGYIEDPIQFKRTVFLAGLDSHIRKQVWPFLLGFYPFESSTLQRYNIYVEKELEWKKIRNQRNLTYKDESAKLAEALQRDIQRVDKDSTFYSGDNNSNCMTLQELLLDYLFHNRDISYVQSMTELMSPLLMTLQDEAETFWCFDSVMKKHIFISSPNDTDMDIQLTYLRELLRLLNPTFFQYTESISDTEFLYCHRWMILCFKREFPLPEVMCIWEVCWAHYATDYFHLFLCLAIIEEYGVFCVEKQLSTDDALMYFSSLSGKIDHLSLLSTARRLLFEFRCLSSIPCILSSMCYRCGNGMWDSGHIPKVVCPNKIHNCTYLRNQSEDRISNDGAN